MTGDVRRIADEVKARKESNLSIMKKGLIQHKNAGEAPVSVQLKVILNDTPLTIKRVLNRNETTFLRDDTTVTITKSEGIQGESIDEIFNGNLSVTENFYDHFTCSHDKNIRIYEKGRKDLYDLFKLYLGGNSSIDSLMLCDRHSEYREKWGSRHFWARGYYVATVGNVYEATILEYIRGQEESDKLDDGIK